MDSTQAAGDINVTITLFENFAAATKREETHSLADLAGRIRQTSRARKDWLPWLKLAQFGEIRTEKNSLRNDANVLAITGIEADYDAEVMTVQEAVERLTKAGILSMLYTSPSHTEDTPRWRVLCPTSVPLAPDRREKLMGRLNGLFRGVFSTESWTLSQAYYFGCVNRNPSHEVHVVEGSPIDEHDDLDEVWHGKPATITSAHVNGESAVRWIDEAALLHELTSGASYHMAQVRLLGRWARTRVPFMEARRRLIEAFETIPRDARDGRWKARYEDIDRCVEDIYGAEAHQIDQGNRRSPAPEEPPAWLDEVPSWDGVENQAFHATEPPPEDEAELLPFPASEITLEEWTTIPPREKVYGHFLFRKFISALGAPGGAGKTAYAFVIAFAVATWRTLLGEKVYESGGVWIYNLEDPRTELLRRVKAAALAHGITYPEVASRLFLDSGRDRPLVIAQKMKDGTVLAWPQVPALIAEIKRREVRLLIVDPFVRSHRVEENHNDEIDFVAALWASVADQADCAILLVHHFKKGGMSGDAAAFRGASALIDASRAAVTLTTMSADEADKLGVTAKDRWQYVRVDNAKLNLAPPPDSAVWLHLEGIDLDNAMDGREADNVQSVTRWEPPSSFEDMSMNAVVRTLERLSHGPGAGEQYYLTGGVTGRWAGLVIMAETGKTIGQAKQIIAAWKKSGLIKPTRYDSPADRKERGGMEVNPVMMEEMRQADAPQFPE